jgi:hypothetical protein
LVSETAIAPEAIRSYIVMYDNIDAQGVLSTTITTPDGELLWSHELPVEVPPGKSQSSFLNVMIETTQKYVVIQGEVALGSEQRRVFMEIVSLEGGDIYLPIVIRGP